MGNSDRGAERKFEEWVVSTEEKARKGMDRLPEGKPVPVSIVLGITNGTYSEVVSGDLQEGMEVIVEETSAKKGAALSGFTPLSRGLGR